MIPTDHVFKYTPQTFSLLYLWNGALYKIVQRRVTLQSEESDVAFTSTGISRFFILYLQQESGSVVSLQVKSSVNHTY